MVRRALLSCAATQLLRSLIARTGLDPDEIFVGRFRSVDWQSLTFTGERHILVLRLAGADPAGALAGLRDGLAEAEWQLRGHVVADIVIVSESVADDGSIVVGIEALTLSD